MPYRNLSSSKQTPQSEAILGKDQVQNNAGGFGFAVDKWTRLQRFLILGSAEGTYYVGARELTKRNAESILECIKEDGQRVVAETARVSVEGRAPKNDPALFVLALCASFGDGATKQKALYMLNQVARIGTHLFHFAAYVNEHRGWGRALRRAVAQWYNEKDPKQLAYQAVKYQQRDGWSHRDLLRLAHPRAKTASHQNIYHWITQGKVSPSAADEDTNLRLIVGFEKAKTADERQTVALIQDYGLTREMIQTEHLKSPDVWRALLETMPITATIRNLGNMGKAGLLVPGAFETIGMVTSRITSLEALKKGRVHPLSILTALRTYQSGRGYRGSGEWEVVGEITDALDQAFYLAFGAVEPTNKRLLLGLDVSSSMGAEIQNMNLTCRDAAAAMAMVTHRVEPMTVPMAFTSGGRNPWQGRDDQSLAGFVPFNMGKTERLDAVIRRMDDLACGATDCALPMLYAIKKQLEIDTFIVYTDSETWAGQIHPCQALWEYRRLSGIPAKLIVVGMTSSGFTIADPDDAGMLDVVGFDTGVPNVMREFILA